MNIEQEKMIVESLPSLYPLQKYEEDAIRVVLDALPSAEPEIVRCKDCKHWDGVDTCDVIDAPVWDNDFCSLAERRSHE